MKKPLILFIIILQTLSPLFSQRDYNYIPYRKSNKWGYCDSTKKVLIKPAYDSVTVFFALNKIDEKDKYVAVVKKSDKYGLINKAGKVLIPIIYERIIWDYQKLHLFLNKHRYEYNKESGKPVDLGESAPASFFEPAIFQSVRISCESTDYYLKFSKTSPGNFLVIKGAYDWDKKLYAEDSSSVLATNLKNVPCSYNLLYVAQNKKWGLITSKGTITIKPEYDSIYQLRWESAYAVKRNNKWKIVYVNTSMTNPSDHLTSSQGEYDEVRRDIDSDASHFIVRKGHLWGISLGSNNPDIFLSREKYYRYIRIDDSKTFAVYDNSNRLYGHISFNGLKYWD